MNDQELTGKELGGELDELRQAARVWLPRMADGYFQASESLKTYGSGEVMPSKYDRPEYFQLYYRPTPQEDLVTGGPSPKVPGGQTNSPMATWMELCTILEAAFGNACDEFADGDTAAGDKLETLRDDMEGIDEDGNEIPDDDTKDDEWTKKPEKTHPPKHDDPRDVETV